MKIVKIMYEVMAALMLALAAVVAILALNRISGINIEGIHEYLVLLIPFAVAAVLFTVLFLAQKKAEAKRAFLILYIKAHLMALAAIAAIYVAIVVSGDGNVAPLAIIICTIFMIITAAVMWRIIIKFEIWE